MKKKTFIRRAFPLAALVTAAAFNAHAEDSIGFAEAAGMAVEASGELRGGYAANALREGAWRWGIRSYLPRLSFTASEDDRVSETGPDSFMKNYSLNIDQLLWDGGRLSLSRKMEKADLDLAADRLRQTASDLAGDGVSRYLDVLQARSLLEIKQKTLESLDGQRRILELEAGLGLVRQTELLEAEITVALAALETGSLSLDLEEAEWRLADKIGLETLPLLSGQIDTGRGPELPGTDLVCSLAESRSARLSELRYAVAKRQAEARAASLSWVPSLRLTGSFALSGRQYPLSRYGWSVGLSLDFSSPWLSGAFSAGGGKDPPHEKNARLQQTLTPAPEPGAAFSRESAGLALALERERYGTALREVRAAAERGVKQCGIMDKRRLLALETLKLEREKLKLAEIKLSLGEITRLDLMEAALECERRESALVEAAVAVLQVERDLERLLDLEPGGLSALAEKYGRGNGDTI